MKKRYAIFSLGDNHLYTTLCEITGETAISYKHRPLSDDGQEKPGGPHRQSYHMKGKYIIVGESLDVLIRAKSLIEERARLTLDAIQAHRQGLNEFISIVREQVLAGPVLQ